MNDHDTWRYEVAQMTEIERAATEYECGRSAGTVGGPEDAND